MEYIQQIKLFFIHYIYVQIGTSIILSEVFVNISNVKYRTALNVILISINVHVVKQNMIHLVGVFIS